MHPPALQSSLANNRKFSFPSWSVKAWDRSLPLLFYNQSVACLTVCFPSHSSPCRTLTRHALLSRKARLCTPMTNMTSGTSVPRLRASHTSPVTFLTLCAKSSFAVIRSTMKCGLRPSIGIRAGIRVAHPLHRHHGFSYWWCPNFSGMRPLWFTFALGACLFLLIVRQIKERFSWSIVAVTVMWMRPPAD